ncbi:hypothetical protein [Saccharomonospora iraqiensis]|uniref:hypothetical protein n=1 Tax=Saccharomonospora iraqiensis TaxID=52698 RepID=UPI00022DED40|nr:hypothetical protein [Saccharomonospora iraqiensis]
MRSRQTRATAAGIGVAAVTAAATVSVTPAASADPAPPPECGPACERVVDVVFPESARFAAWRDTSAPGGRAVLAYYVADELHDSTVLEHRDVTGGDCGRQGDAWRCTVGFDEAMHGSGALTALLTGDDGITVSDELVGNAPGAELVRLNGDDRPDLALRQSTYEPNYAEAPQYWETYVEVGGTFLRTGCTTPRHDDAPTPTEPAYGSCSHPGWSGATLSGTPV